MYNSNIPKGFNSDGRRTSDGYIGDIRGVSKIIIDQMPEDIDSTIVPENLAYKALNFYHLYFSCLRRLDAPTLEEKTRQLAKEISQDLDHKFRPVVSFLIDRLAAEILFK